MKMTKDFKEYLIFIDNKEYRIIAKSKEHAINTSRFKHCYLECLTAIKNYSVVNRIELRKAIKEFDKSRIKFINEGFTVQHGEVSSDKREVKRCWKILNSIYKEQLLNDAFKHEEEMLCDIE